MLLANFVPFFPLVMEQLPAVFHGDHTPAAFDLLLIMGNDKCHWFQGCFFTLVECKWVSHCKMQAMGTGGSCLLCVFWGIYHCLTSVIPVSLWIKCHLCAYGYIPRKLNGSGQPLAES